jgi:hypothetical protein
MCFMRFGVALGRPAEGALEGGKSPSSFASDARCAVFSQVNAETRRANSCRRVRELPIAFRANGP